MKSLRKGAPAFPPPPKIWLITMTGEAAGEGDGLGVGDGIGVGVGVGAVPPITSDVGLLCTPSVVTTSVHLPAPRNSAGTDTCNSSSPIRFAGATVSTAGCFPQIVTETFLARTAPVAKIDNLSSPLEGSNGPALSVSELRTIASPRPSPATVNTPGAVAEMNASAFDDSPSQFDTRNSPGPFDSPSGTTNTTSSAAA